MLPCKHKYPIQILNEGYCVEHCKLHAMSVNDVICERCPDREGDLPHEPAEIDFPKRGEEELRAIANTCGKCPLFDEATQRCQDIPWELHPVSTWSQHPSSHCPRKLW